jgi:hypothetical protein
MRQVRVLSHNSNRLQQSEETNEMLVDDKFPFDLRMFAVFIDGEYTENCMVADDKAGWAIMRNEDFELIKAHVRFEIHPSRSQTKINLTELEIREAIDLFNRTRRPNYDPLTTLEEWGVPRK